MLIKFLDGSSREIENLSNADFSRVNLSDAILPEDYKIARLDFGGWSICVYPDKTSIGCQTHSNEKWLQADPRWIALLGEDASVWWERHGDAVRSVIRDVMEA